VPGDKEDVPAAHSTPPRKVKEKTGPCLYHHAGPPGLPECNIPECMAPVNHVSARGKKP